MDKSNYVGKGDRWQDIADLVNRWKRRHPEKYRQNMEWVKDTRQGLHDKQYAEWGGDKRKHSVGGSGMRLGLCIHPELLNYIETFHHDFMKTNKDVQEFGKRFPAFQIPEKI